MDFEFIDIYSISFWFIAFGVLIVIACILKLWKDISLIKTIYIGVALVISSALFVAFHFLYSEVFAFPFIISSLDEFDANFALAFLGTITGVVALFGGFLAIQRTDESKRTNKIADDTNKITMRQNEIANRQANTAEQESITARIDRATEGLGKKDGKIPIIEARIGALISLEQIAQDNIRYHISVMEILCAYVRYNSPKDDGGKEQGHLREDLQTAITIIGRRDRWQDGKKHLEKEIKQKYKIDLCKCNLRRADFADANLSNASLIGANLRGASFISAELSYAWLDSANFKGAELHKAYAHETDFSECENLTQEQVNQMFCGIGVIIPESLTRPEHWPTDKMSWDKFYSLYKEWIKETHST